MEVSGSDCSQKIFQEANTMALRSSFHPIRGWKRKQFRLWKREGSWNERPEENLPWLLCWLSAKDVQVIKKRNIPESVPGSLGEGIWYKPTVEGTSRRTYLIKLDQINGEGTSLLTEHLIRSLPPILHLEDKEKSSKMRMDKSWKWKGGGNANATLFFTSQRHWTVLEHNDLKTLSHANRCSNLVSTITISWSMVMRPHFLPEVL